MSDIDRMRDFAAGAIAGAGVALVVVVLFLTFLAAQQVRSEREYRAYAEKHAQDTEGRAEPPLIFCRRFEGEKESPTAQRCEQARQYADLDAQEGMWAVGIAQAIIGALGFLGLIGTVFFAYKAWKEAERANAETREQFIEGRRPWLQVAITKTDCRKIGERITIWVEFSVTNLGATPATHVAINPPQAAHYFGGKEESELSFQMDLDRHRPIQADDVVFPNKQTPLVRSTTIVAPPEYWKERAGSFMIAGWVRYRYAGSERYHLTPFAYVLSFWRNRENTKFESVAQAERIRLAPD